MNPTANGDQKSALPPLDIRGYRFSRAITEEQTTSETYGIQFCLKPSEDQLRGGGSIWKSAVDPRNVLDFGDNREEKIQENKFQNGTQDTDCEIIPVPNASGSTKWRNIFVTCTGINVRVYETKKRAAPQMLQHYKDSDSDESFYSVATTFNADNTNSWWILAAGKRGVLRVINLNSAILVKSMTGHGEAINDVKIHPRDPALALTASKDESLRLWNLRSGVTIAMFSGVSGHRSDVLYADFDLLGRRFASCGIDNSIRLWDIDDHDVVTKIIESHEAADCGAVNDYTYRDKEGIDKKFIMGHCQIPYFITTKVHTHYVDCVMWVGELLLTKSVHNLMRLWEPGYDRQAIASLRKNYTLVEEYPLRGCKVWYIRFGMDRTRRLVACGNDKVSTTNYFISFWPPSSVQIISNAIVLLSFALPRAL